MNDDRACSDANVVLSSRLRTGDPAVAASSRTTLIRRQRHWADRRGIAHDARGYTTSLGANLRADLSDAVRAELARGSELLPGATRPPRLQSVYSSAALVLNVFAYWHSREPGALLAALGLEEEPGLTLTFEEPLPTGLAGEPPTADVALRAPGAGRLVAIESKFGEWLVRRPRGRPFKDKYFPPQARVWEAAGLPRCQAHAEALQRGELRYRWLNAAQLLKHALGLQRTGCAVTTLVYLYYDQAGREAAAHGAELERLRVALGPEVRWCARTYQELYSALRARSGVDPAYLGYLHDRYFG